MTESVENKKTTKSLRGVVESISSEQTIKVKVLVLKSHPKYRKVLKLSTVMTVHDDSNAAQVGDVVSIRPCKPHSKTKSWEVAHIFPR